MTRIARTDKQRAIIRRAIKNGLKLGHKKYEDLSNYLNSEGVLRSDTVENSPEWTPQAVRNICYNSKISVRAFKVRKAYTKKDASRPTLTHDDNNEQIELMRSVLGAKLSDTRKVVVLQKLLGDL